MYKHMTLAIAILYTWMTIDQMLITVDKQTYTMCFIYNNFTNLASFCASIWRALT